MVLGEIYEKLNGWFKDYGDDQETDDSGAMGKRKTNNRSH